MNAGALPSFECQDVARDVAVGARRADGSKVRRVTKGCVGGIVLILSIAVIGYLAWDRASKAPQADAETPQAYAAYPTTGDMESAFRMAR